MQAFTTHHGIVAPLDRSNVDTDAILPATYLKSVTRTGFAEGLFTYWRYLGQSRQPDPNFVLNMSRYQHATILLTRENFGCGSSREHAPWALYEYGFRAVIASSFADIFSTNCFNVGILPLQLAAESIHMLFDAVEATEGYTLTISLPEQVVIAPQGQIFPFEIDPFRKNVLMQGLDMIERTLQFQQDIAAFEAQHNATVPWY